MKAVKSLTILLLILLMVSCYKVNNYDYLNITFNDNKLNPYFLEKYIDSIRNKNLALPDSIKDIFLFGSELEQQERLIYFKNKPQEWYMINFNATPCWIEEIYNKKLSNSLINKRDSLGEKELKRIENRFRNEVLKPAELYGKAHHLPDSVIYNTCCKP